MSARDGYPSVFVMNADGSEQTNLTPKDPGDLDVRLGQPCARLVKERTPDLLHVIAAEHRARHRTFIINADGTGPTRLTSSIGMDGSPRAR